MCEYPSSRLELPEGRRGREDTGLFVRGFITTVLQLLLHCEPSVQGFVAERRVAVAVKVSVPSTSSPADATGEEERDGSSLVSETGKLIFLLGLMDKFW